VTCRHASVAVPGRTTSTNGWFDIGGTVNSDSEYSDYKGLTITSGLVPLTFTGHGV